jgi:hypothetical protein
MNADCLFVSNLRFPVFLGGFFILAGLGFGQAPAERQSTASYPARAEWRDFRIGAEFLGHTAPGLRQAVYLKNYVVVEVLLEPNSPLARITADRFRLRINGRKQALYAQSPGMVAAGLKWDDWERSRRVTLGAGVDDAQVVIGAPRTSPRFPGDPTSRPLPRPRAPAPEDRSGIEAEPGEAPADMVVNAALPEGPAPGPVRGLIYFPYKDKLKNIKSLELEYQPTEGAPERLPLPRSTGG